jgi:hypothetical protein
VMTQVSRTRVQRTSGRGSGRCRHSFHCKLFTISRASAGLSVTAQFVPVIRIYATNDYGGQFYRSPMKAPRDVLTRSHQMGVQRLTRSSRSWWPILENWRTPRPGRLPRILPLHVAPAALRMLQSADVVVFLNRGHILY